MSIGRSVSLPSASTGSPETSIGLSKTRNAAASHVGSGITVAVTLASRFTVIGKGEPACPVHTPVCASDELVSATFTHGSSSDPPFEKSAHPLAVRRSASRSVYCSDLFASSP